VPKKEKERFHGGSAAHLSGASADTLNAEISPVLKHGDRPLLRVGEVEGCVARQTGIVGAAVQTHRAQGRRRRRRALAECIDDGRHDDGEQHCAHHEEQGNSQHSYYVFFLASGGWLPGGSRN
jgi:hypothetical protein